MSTYSRVRAERRAKRTPCQPSLTCGPETPEPRWKRPPERVSRVAAVIAVIAGVRAGICMTPAPRPIVLGLRAEPGEHGRGVGAVGLGDPRLRVAEPLGLLDEPRVSVPRPMPAYPR